MSFLPHIFLRHKKQGAAELINEILLSSKPDWGAYIDFLQDKEMQNGIDTLSDTEINVVSAYQFYVCINSSGLFSYFDLQTLWAQFGFQSMNAIGLPIYANLIQTCLEQVNLSPNAKELEIAAHFTAAFHEDSDNLLDAFVPLEEVFYSGPSVENAVVSYIKLNAKKLSEQFSTNG